MRGVNVASAALGLMIGVLATSPASAWNRGNVQILTVLPDLVGQGAGQPVKSSAEGLTVGPDGNIYVTTFGFNAQGPTTGPANLIVISPNGKIVNPHLVPAMRVPAAPNDSEFAHAWAAVQSI